LKAKYIVSDCDRGLLKFNGLGSFESLWDLRLDWFEEPNHRRNGWSGVSRHVLNRPEGGSVAVFIKRQENHNSRSLLHPLRGLPTIYREYRNLCTLKRYGISCPDLVFYGHRNTGGRWQAILITRSLTGYRPLEDCLNSIEQGDIEARKSLLASVARTLSEMHACHLRHGSLHAKHILVRAQSRGSSGPKGAYEFDSAVVDLEKMRTRFPLSWLVVRDLDQLHRHWRRTEGDWEAFIDGYLARIEHGFPSGKVKEAIACKRITDWTQPGRSVSPDPSGIPAMFGFSRPQTETVSWEIQRTLPTDYTDSWR